MKKKCRSLILLAMLILLLVSVGSVSAQGPGEGGLSALPGTVDELLTPEGVAAVTGFVISILMTFDWFQNMPENRAKYKPWIIYGLNLAVAILAQIVLKYVETETLAAANVWYAFIYAAMGSMISEVTYNGKKLVSAWAERYLITAPPGSVSISDPLL